MCIYIYVCVIYICVYICDIYICICIICGFSWWLSGKESACNAGDPGLIPGSGRSLGERKWLPTPLFLPGEPQGQRSLAGYSPWSCKESDTTE